MIADIFHGTQSNSKVVCMVPYTFSSTLLHVNSNDSNLVQYQVLKLVQYHWNWLDFNLSLIAVNKTITSFRNKKFTYFRSLST